MTATAVIKQIQTLSPIEQEKIFDFLREKEAWHPSEAEWRRIEEALASEDIDQETAEKQMLAGL